MNHRVVSGVLLILSLLGILSGYLISHQEVLSLCESGQAGCVNQSLLFGVGHPLYLSIYLLPVLFAVLLFVRKEVFSFWWKAMLPFALVGLFFIVISPPLPELLTPDRTFVTERVVWILVGISIILIAWKYWRLHKK